MSIGKRRTQWFGGACATAGAIALCVAPLASASTAADTTQFSVIPGSLAFVTAPDVPNLPTLTLSGQAQTLNAAMNSFTVADATGAGSGWNVTVNGDSSGGKSAVFKQYCPIANCGSDTLGYTAASPQTLAVDSLTLNSTGAGFSAVNSTGTMPTHSCNAGCNVDSAAAVKIVSAASGAGLGTYTANSFTGTSVALAAPTTIRALPTSEIYHLDLVWTLTSGP